MIPYHGTPMGGKREEVARFFRGRHALVPFPRQEDIGVVAEVCQSFVLDNGAYTVWKQGGAVDVEGFTRWVYEWFRHPGFDWALIPDVIDGDEHDNDALLKDWPTDLKNAGVPIWHLHESIDRLVQLANEWRVVALGSSGEWGTPGTQKWWARMREALNQICDEYGRPICKLHGLRMLAPKVFSELPLASADSTNAVRNYKHLDRYGMYVPPTGAQRAEIIAARTEAHNSASHFERTEDEFWSRFIGIKRAA